MATDDAVTFPYVGEQVYWSEIICVRALSAQETALLRWSGPLVTRSPSNTFGGIWYAGVRWSDGGEQRTCNRDPEVEKGPLAAGLDALC